MAEKSDGGLRDVLVEWHDSQQQIYAVLFDHFGEKQRIPLGTVVDLNDGVAVIADGDEYLRIPITAPTMRAKVQERGSNVKSLVLTWEDGNSAFVATRKGGPSR